MSWGSSACCCRLCSVSVWGTQAGIYRGLQNTSLGVCDLIKNKSFGAKSKNYKPRPRFSKLTSDSGGLIFGCAIWNSIDGPYFLKMLLTTAWKQLHAGSDLHCTTRRKVIGPTIFLSTISWHLIYSLLTNMQIWTCPVTLSAHPWKVRVLQARLSENGGTQNYSSLFRISTLAGVCIAERP